MNDDYTDINKKDMYAPDNHKNDENAQENIQNEKNAQEDIQNKMSAGDIHFKELRKSTDDKKIRPMKKLAETGRVEHLKYILPLSQYSSDFLRKIAKDTTCKIILRELQKSFSEQNISESDKSRYINLLVSLEPKYNYIKKFDLKDSKIQAVLINILAQGDKDFTVKQLGELLVDTDKYTRATAVKIIAELLSSTQINLLIKLLHDPDERVRANVIEALESIGNKNVVGILLRYKKDKDERVRANTLKALWTLGYKDIEEPLVEMLLDSNESMQSSAVWVIGEIAHNQNNLQSLLKMVEHEDDPSIKLKVNQAKRKIQLREREIRILVIDDDKEFMRGFFQNLAKDGFHILAAFNGETGFRSALIKKPEIIVVNYKLPDMDGNEVIIKLKGKEITKNIPVLMLLESNKKEKLGVDKEFNDYLIKPLEYDDFIDKIKILFNI